MSNEAVIQDALKLEKLDFPDRPVVEAIEAEPYLDSTGVDSLRVSVILSDATEDDEITGEAVVQIKSAIADSLIASGIDLFPYTDFIKRVDYEENKNLR